MTQDPRISEFIMLLTSHEVRLRAFALSLIPNWADAEEVLQQANLVMWQKFGAFELGSSFFSWAAKIIHLTARDFRKRQRRELVQFGDRFFEAVALETAAASEELVERERVLGECMKKLKPKQRGLLKLRYEKESSGEEMARCMNISVDAVYQALGRIRKSLFDCVNRGLREGGLT